MKLHEAIEAARNDPDIWFRPVKWKGCLAAFVISHNSEHTMRVPSARGGHAEMTYFVETLIGDWELTDADTVLSGN